MSVSRDEAVRSTGSETASNRDGKTVGQQASQVHEGLPPSSLITERAAIHPTGRVPRDEAHLAFPVPTLPEPTLATFQWAAASSSIELSNPGFVSVK